MLPSSFYELAIEFAKKQTGMVDQFTEDAPILASLPMEASTHGLQNVYEEIVNVDAAEQVDLDVTMPEINIETKLVQENLSKFGAIMTVGEDLAENFGGKAKYFAKRTPTFLRKTGMNMEYAILYNVLRSKAYANAKWTNAGGTANANYTMLIVRWMPGENMGLYDAKMFGSGKVFDIKKISGGNLYDIEKNSTKMLGYGQRFATYFGTQIANLNHLSAVMNIDLDDDGAGDYKYLPTEMMIDDALDDARAGAGTMIYCHPKVKRALGKYKSARLNIAVPDKNFSKVIDFWDDIPIITSRNFLKGTEGKVV